MTVQVLLGVIAVTAALGSAALILFALVVVSIKREDRGSGLRCRPRGRWDASARRLTGLTVWRCDACQGSCEQEKQNRSTEASSAREFPGP